MEDASCDELLWTAVFYHSAYRIPEGLEERTAMFCHILRDADKVDTDEGITLTGDAKLVYTGELEY